jgi:DNA adenine methylase
MIVRKEFGNRLKEIRIKAMLSQNDLASLSGIDRAQISKIESGAINVTLETIERLSSAVNIPMPELLDFNNGDKAHPFVKWAGVKTQFLSRLKEFMPSNYNDYYEPFVGGGALLFEISPRAAVINDYNSELICVYKCFLKERTFKLLINELDKHERNHSEDYFLKIREMDRQEDFINQPEYIRAARMIYLNKACFNGLYRVNSKGYFNVPSGKKEKVRTYDLDNYNRIFNYFNSSHIEINNCDFEVVVKKAKKGDFVYFDPPYDTLDGKESFTAYSKDNFGKEDQIRLSNLFKELSEKGVFVMLSNHNTKLINDLYKDYNIHVINARRSINSKGDLRGPVEEVIITNY